MTDIAIVEQRLMGVKLGTIFARAGHEVVFSYAHSKEKLKRLAMDAQGNARDGTSHEAAQAFYTGWPTAASGFGHLKKVIDQQ